MQKGWERHIPLNMLTLEHANSEFMNPTPERTLVTTALDGSIVAQEVLFSKEKEFQLSFSTWSFAYNRLLELIDAHYPGPDEQNIQAVYEAFQHHFFEVRDTPAAQTMWPIYLEYDIRVRSTFADHGILPGDLQHDLIMAIQSQYLARQAEAIPALIHAHSRSQSSQRFRPYSDSADRSAFNRRASFCFFCGKSGHAPTRCREPKPFLVQNDAGQWVAPGNRQVCYKFNGTSNICTGCEREHICSLCGSKDHAARRCRLRERP